MTYSLFSLFYLTYKIAINFQNQCWWHQKVKMKSLDAAYNSTSNKQANRQCWLFLNFLERRHLFYCRYSIWAARVSVGLSSCVSASGLLWIAFLFSWLCHLMSVEVPLLWKILNLICFSKCEWSECLRKGKSYD